MSDWVNRVYLGSCEHMDAIPDASIDCCVTSPPYWGLRDYGVEGQIGMEATPAEYVARLVGAFREVRRVLRDDGTLWVNIGDSYCGSPRGSDNGREKSGVMRGRDLTGWKQSGSLDKRRSGLKPKDLVGVPWMLAFALREDGWWLRSDIIWHKLSCLPESVTDRPTKNHEYLFLLSKSRSYYYDQNAIKERLADSSIDRLSQTGLLDQTGSERANGGAKSNGPMKAVFDRNRDGRKIEGADVFKEAHATGTRSGGNLSAAYKGVDWSEVGANKRTVWSVAPAGYAGAHFAVFPPDLIRPCIMAGSRPGGIVLDPFMGSGTTARVALEHGRKFVGYELNPQYHDLISDRLGLFGETA